MIVRGLTVLDMKRNRKIAALSKDISDCNGSLAYGDIGFGDGELNWLNYYPNLLKCKPSNK